MLTNVCVDVMPKMAVQDTAVFLNLGLELLDGNYFCLRAEWRAERWCGYFVYWCGVGSIYTADPRLAAVGSISEWGERTRPWPECLYPDTAFGTVGT